MHQSLSNHRLRQLKEGDPTARPLPPQHGNHDDLPAERELCIVWDTGRVRSFLYRDYIGADYNPENDPATLELFFTSGSVVLEGYHLDKLRARLMQDQPETIAVIPDRYTPLSGDDGFIVIQAHIGK